MKNKRLMLAAAAFTIGFAAFQAHAVALKKSLQGGQLLETLVVVRDLPKGHELRGDDLSIVELPEDYLDPRRVLAARREETIGARLGVPLRAGEALVESDLVRATAPSRLSTVLPPGRRAYHLAGQANPFSDLLRPEDRVDLLLLKEARARTLLQNLRVLSVDGRLAGEEDSAQPRAGVTLDVSRKEAERLFSAEAEGRLRISLRNPADEAQHGAVASSSSPSQVRAEQTARPPTTREIEHVR